MTLGEKIRYLREVEGSLRGLNRPLTQQELMKGIQTETGKTISQSYLSQIEGGKRPHMTQSSRTLLARFFKVHPGFWLTTPRATTRNWPPTCAPPKVSSMSGCSRAPSVSPAIPR